jgi:RecB family exonuclease
MRDASQVPHVENTLGNVDQCAYSLCQPIAHHGRDFVSTIHLVPFGRPATRALQRAIAAAKGDDPLQPVTVAVPSNYAGLSLRRTLGASPGGLVNVRFIVLARVAELLGSPVLASAGKRPLTSAVRAEAARAALAAEPGIFAPFRENASTERSLEGTFRELRRAPEESLDVMAGQSARAAQVVRLYRDFRDRTGGYYDEEDLAFAAAASVAAAPTALRDIGHVVLFLPRHLSCGEGALVDALATAGHLSAVVGLTGEDDTDTLARGIAARLAVSLGPATEERKAINDGSSRIILVTDAEEEVRTVLRLASARLAAGIPLHRIAVFYRAAQPYALLTQEQFRAAGVPFHGPGVRSLAQTATGRTVLGLFRVRESGFRRDVLADWLCGGPVLEEQDGAPAPAQRWDLVSRSAGIVRAPEQWRDRLARHVRSLQAERGSLEERENVTEGSLRRIDSEIEYAERLARFVERLASDLQYTGQLTWPAFAAWARGLLEGYLGGEGHRRDWPEGEIEAHRSVVAAVEGLAELAALRPKIDEPTFRRALERELEASAGRVGRFGEGVFLGRLADAMGCDFDVAFLVGMSEGLLPPRDRDDPLIPDRERLEAGEDVPLRTARSEEERHNYLAALASAKERVFLFPRTDVRGQRGKMPAPWLLREASQLEGRPLYSSDLLDPASRPWLTVVPSFQSAIGGGPAPGSLQEYDLRSLLRWRLAGHPALEHYLVRAEAVLRGGLEADIERQTERFTRWDGWVGPNAAPVPSADRPVSASALQTWAQCPFRYFLGNVLRVAETERPEDALTISAADRGTVLHRALERFLREAQPRESPGHRWADAERDLMRRIGEECCAQAEAEGITGRSLLWRLERARILRDLDGFLAKDEEVRAELGVVPLEVEVSFGLADPGSKKAANVELGDGRAIAVRGKIDRVDRAPDGSRLVVIDYKSGSPYSFRKLSEDPVKRGELLQLPLYAVAARSVYGEAPVRAFYWFATEQQSYDHKGYEVDDRVMGRFKEVLGVILDGIEAGVFPSHPGQRSLDGFESCRYCPYEAACARQRDRVWERKRGAPALAAYVRLTEGEDDD